VEKPTGSAGAAELLAALGLDAEIEAEIEGGRKGRPLDRAGRRRIEVWREKCRRVGCDGFGDGDEEGLEEEGSSYWLHR
jgi:hypothetical protein